MSFILLGTAKKRNEFFCFPAPSPELTEPMAELLSELCILWWGYGARWLKQVRMPGAELDRTSAEPWLDLPGWLVSPEAFHMVAMGN